MDPRWKHPFTCIVAGPTGCGKTMFVARLLQNASTMIDPSPSLAGKRWVRKDGDLRLWQSKC